MSAEDPLAARTRASPSSQRNGREDRPGPGARPVAEEARGSARQAHPEQLSTGPASWIAKGSSSSIPFIDCSDIDSEYDVARGQVSRWQTNQNYREQAMPRHGSGTGSVNGPFLSQQEHFLGRKRCRESPSPSKPTLNMSIELGESAKQSYQSGHQSPVHSTMVDINIHSRERHSSSPLTVQHGMGSKSAVATTVMSNIHRTSSLSHAEQNGLSSAPSHLDDRNRGISTFQGSRSDEGPTHCGSYSPVPSRSPNSQKLHNVHKRSDTDACIPNQGPSKPAHDSRPVLPRAERMAALERRMMANGLSVPGKAKSSPGQKRLGQAGVTHVGAVQMNDATNTSGSESSESEVENTRGNTSSPLKYGSPMEAKSSSPLPRNKFSFGSLQLDEEADEDGCHAFNDEDGGHIFSC